MSPPDASCCTTGWDKDVCSNTLQDAIDDADDWTILQLEPGIYCNEKWTPKHKSYWDLTHKQIVKINEREKLMIRGGADNCASKPKLLFDGSGGIDIKDSKHIYLENFEIEGPSLQITGEEAT